MSDEPFQVGERGDPRDRIANQQPLRSRQPVPTCDICDGAVVPVSLTAEGQTLACPCGRTTMTILSKGKLDLGRE